MSKTVRTLIGAVCVVGASVCFAELGNTRDGRLLLFEEDFETGASRWEMTDPDAWAVRSEDDNHIFALERPSDYAPKVRSPLNIALIRDLSVGSFLFEATVKQTGRDYDHRDLCFFFGHRDPSKFYYVHLASKADPHAHSIFLVNDTARVSIAEVRTEGVVWDDEAHRVRIIRDAKSGSIEVFFDDMERPIMSTVDKTFVSGAIGVGSFDDTGTFDDILVLGPKLEIQNRRF